MRLPDPALSLTLPSLCDDTTLACRIYHPACLRPSSLDPEKWQRHAAVVGHPYAPMGGDYDNGVVHLVVATLLRLGYVVGTFNFRGAHPSGGRTSWTAKSEVADYTSFAGFMVYYIHHLRSASSPKQSTPTFLMAGYSYSSLVTSMLPPLPQMLEPLAAPALGSAAAEIRLRAQHLAEQQNTILSQPKLCSPPTTPGSPASPPASPRRNVAVRVGGDEAATQRRSHDLGQSRPSFNIDGERVRESVGELLGKTRFRKKGSTRSVGEGGSRGAAVQQKVPPPPLVILGAEDALLRLRPAYLLISPLQGLIGHLAAMSLPAPMWKHKPGDKNRSLETKLLVNPTLAIFGDRDSFVNVSRLREWSARLTSAPGNPQFTPVEVSGAGHMWIEPGVAELLEGAVARFAQNLLNNDQE